MTSRRIRFDIRQARQPILIALLALLALNGVFYLFSVEPKVREYRRIAQDNDPRFIRLEERQKEVERLEAFVGALVTARADLHHLRHEILSTREQRMVEVQLELADLCKQFNIDLNSVAYNSDTFAQEGLELFRMIVPLEGGYSALRRFLQAIESSDKFLVVERVVLGESQEGGVMLQLNITLDTYFNAPLQQTEGRRERRA